MRGSTELRRGAELFALSGLALVQPVLDVLGRSPETFVFREVDGAALVGFAVLVALTPALALWAVGLLSGLLGPTVRRVVHLVSVGGLVAVAVLVALRLGGMKGPAVLLLASLLAALAVVAHERVAGVRLFLLYLSPLPVLAALLFLFGSDVSGLVRGGEAEVAEDVESTRSVVMLLLDEFPTATILGEDGLVDAEEYPNLARLSRQSTWYRNYTTHNAGTVQAVPSVLSGQLPERGRAPLVTDWPTNLFTLLGGAYDMAVQETVTQLCPTDVCAGSRTVTRDVALDGGGFGEAVGDAWDVARRLVSLEAEAEVEVDQFTEEVLSVEAPAEADPDARDTVTAQPARFTAFLDGMVEGEDPTLHFAHLILPHGPWRFFPDGTEYESPDADPEGQIAGNWVHPWPAELTRLRLELQARYTDALVGQTMDRLRETGLWDDAVFLLVTDHGGAFVVGSPGRAVSDTNTHEVMWAPMFLRAPGLPRGVDDTDVEATDVLPTLAEILEIDLEYDVDGASVLSSPDTSGVKRYQRLQNPFQPEPDALLEIDTATNYAALLDDAWPDVDVEDPVGGFYRRQDLGDLYGRPVDDLDVGAPAGSVDVDQEAALASGTDSPVPAYVGGQVDAEDAGDGDWVVLAVDGTVQGFSQLFPMVDTDTAFAVLLDQTVADGRPHDIELFLTTDAGAELRPLTIS